MKKNFQPLLVFVIFSFIPFGLAAQNNVGIGTLTPSFRLDVQGDPASMLLTNINSKVNYAGPLQIKAFEGTSITADGVLIQGGPMESLAMQPGQMVIVSVSMGLPVVAWIIMVCMVMLMAEPITLGSLDKT
jgi:hypothetical protein